MRIVIVGAGEVGYNVAETLSTEGYDVTVVEQDDERAASALIEQFLDLARFGLVRRGEDQQRLVGRRGAETDRGPAPVREAGRVHRNPWRKARAGRMTARARAAKS